VPWSSWQCADPADAGDGSDVVAAPAELTDALGRGVDVTGGEVDPRVGEVVLAGCDRTRRAIGDHVVHPHQLLAPGASDWPRLDEGDRDARPGLGSSSTRIASLS
jgi:hypothetical protein